SAPRGPPERRGGAFGAPSFCSGEAVPRCARTLGGLRPPRTPRTAWWRLRRPLFLFRRSCSSLRSGFAGDDGPRFARASSGVRVAFPPLLVPAKLFLAALGHSGAPPPRTPRTAWWRLRRPLFLF